MLKENRSFRYQRVFLALPSANIISGKAPVQLPKTDLFSDCADFIETIITDYHSSAVQIISGRGTQLITASSPLAKMEATNKNQHDNGNDNTNLKPPSFGVMPRPSTTAVKSEHSYNPQTNTNTNTNILQPETNRKKWKKKKKKRKLAPTAQSTAAVTVPSFGVVSPTATAVAADVPSSSFSLFPGPEHVVSSSSSLFHSSNSTGSNTHNNHHDNMNIGVTILAELKKMEERQTQRQATMQQELLESYQTHADTAKKRWKKEFQKLHDVMTSKIASLEQTVEALLQQQSQQQQQQESITGISDNGSTNNNRTNNESETGYVDGEENDDDNDDGDGDSDDNAGDNNVHADEENRAEIENNNEIIDISSSSSNNGDDDDDDEDWIANDGDEYSVDDNECSDGNEIVTCTTNTDAATAAGATDFNDEDTNDSRFKAWKRKYDVLQEYVKSNSGSIPVFDYKNEQDGFALGLWIDNQKRAYRSVLDGKQSTHRMTKPRVEYLEQIPNWTWGKQISILAEKEFADDEHTRNNNRALLKEEDTNSQRFKSWKRQYGILKEYMKSHEMLPLGRYRNKKDGFGLGWWVTNQKSAYWTEIKGRVRNSGNWMTKSRAEWLESIPNWTWGACCADGTQEKQCDSTNDTNTNEDDADELDDDVIVTKIVTSKSKVSRKRCSQDNDDDTDSDCSSSSNSDENIACRKGKKKTKKVKHRKKKKGNKERESERRRRYYVWE